MGTSIFGVVAIAGVPSPSANYVTLLFDNTGLGVPRLKFSDGSTAQLATTTLATITVSGLMSLGDKKKERLFVDPVADYGAAFDHRVVFDGACAVGAPTKITSATITFVASDLGKRVLLSGAGVAGAAYIGSITNVDSTTQITVSPNISTTVSVKGLQVHTDDLTAWTNLINDVNASTFPAAVIKMEAPVPAVAGFTNRSGISSFLPQITKQVQIDGAGGSHTSDIGDYTKAGGSCIAYAGATQDPTSFGAVLTIAPSLGLTAQALKRVALRHFWIDCRNGDQNPALKGISLLSCHMFMVDDVFVNDPGAVGIELLVVGPGVAVPNALSLGEAKDCTRGSIRDFCIRALDNPAGAQTAPVTTTSAITLSTVGQTLAGLGANTLTLAGYAWVATNLGYPVLVRYTGGGGTASLTGCTISLQDTINAPATVNGSNIVQAVPGNACCIVLDGDLTANANLSHIDTCQLSHGTTWGPAAMEFRNCDSMECTNVIINGGNNTNDGAINRQRKPGVRFNGSNTSSLLPARNNAFKSGSAGVGGASSIGVLNTGTRLLAQAGPNYWDLYALSNGEPIPTVEGSSFLDWEPNGGWRIGHAQATSVTDQAVAAATLSLLTGSLIPVPPQGFQVGTVFRWTITGSSAAVGTAANTITVRLGTTGTTTDAAIATFTTGVGAAVVDTFEIMIELTVRTLGAAATAVASCTVNGSTTAGAAGGFIAQLLNVLTGTMAAFNSTTIQQFLHVALTTGAAKTLTIRQVIAEILNPSNP